MTQEEIDALPDEMELVFRRPIVHGGVTYDKVTLKEPTAGQLSAITKKVGPEVYTTAVALTGAVPIGVAELMLARDLNRAEAFFDSFLERAQTTGDPG